MRFRITIVGLWLCVPAAFLFIVASAQNSQEQGAALYAANCSACHQPQGEGLEGVFPPLAGHLPAFLEQDEGRGYLVSVLVHGLSGPIEVAGSSYDGVMPSWGQLTDEEIAAVLNHELRSWGNRELLPGTFISIQPGEVAKVRETPLTPQQVFELRAAFDLGDAETDTAEPEAVTVGPQRVYTRDQANRGRELYRRRCVECHGDRLEGGVVGGPPLTGGGFIRRWNGGSAAPLYNYLKTQMPQDRPGSMTDGQYADLMAYILSNNGYPAGNQQLPTNLEDLQQIVLGR